MHPQNRKYEQSGYCGRRRWLNKGHGVRNKEETKYAFSKALNIYADTIEWFRDQGFGFPLLGGLLFQNAFDRGLFFTIARWCFGAVWETVVRFAMQVVRPTVGSYSGEHFIRIRSKFMKGLSV